MDIHEEWNERWWRMERRRRILEAEERESVDEKIKLFNKQILPPTHSSSHSGTYIELHSQIAFGVFAARPNHHRSIDDWCVGIQWKWRLIFHQLTAPPHREENISVRSSEQLTKHIFGFRIIFLLFQISRNYSVFAPTNTKIKDWTWKIAVFLPTSHSLRELLKNRANWHVLQYTKNWLTCYDFYIY